MQYVGELLWPGHLGHLGIIGGFVSALLTAVAYFQAEQQRENRQVALQWRNIGRGAFLAHGISILAVLGMLFFVMVEQRYEYQYVWAHVSEDLPFKYIFSAFWEGQEGSFLLWMFWHLVLGLVLLVRGGRWEAPTLAVIALIELFINSMLLGLYFGEWKVGSNPTLLLRQAMDAPIFNNAEYVALLKGNGLNPLLQNYWMTIHPPTLFLGFASTSVPFAFAIAGLWTKEHKAWLKPALPWALFSAAILGLGILMGGAWAYEALSFGGYWAWDPVENMSLVPWLLLVAGIHTNLVAKATGQSIRSSYIFYLLTFIFIVYSTFLTRSGVLGETSVHAFTEMGLEWQLVGFLGFFLLLSIFLMTVRYKQVPVPEKEEAVSSKEFWMFIGSLVLLFSALLITGSTSLPVYNKIMEYFNPAFEGRVITDPIPHYNKYQLWIAVFMGLFSGLAQFLRYRERDFRKNRISFAVHLGIALLLAGVLTWLTGQWIDLVSWQYVVMLFTAWFTVFSNIDYAISIARGNLKMSSSAIAHLGFGLMLVGVLASGLNKRYVSNSPFIMDGLIEGADTESLRRNVLLFKNVPLPMDGYEVTYVEDTVVNFTRTYTVNFKRRNEAGKVVEDFDLYPNILYDKGFSKIAASNPSTRRYWNKDVFTHIASLPQVEMDMDYRRQREDSLNYITHELIPNLVYQFKDTVSIRDLDSSYQRTFTLELVGIDRAPSHPDYEPEPGDLAVGADLIIRRSDDQEEYRVKPVTVLRGQLLYNYPQQVNPINTKVRLNEKVFERVFTFEEDLKYTDYQLKQGEQVEAEGLMISFQGFNRKPNNPAYAPQEGDLPVSALIKLEDPKGSSHFLEPVFLIRNGQPMNLKAEVPELGFHARFTMLDPPSESAFLQFARADQPVKTIPVDVATDSLRYDYIVLEAIEFPGINLFWSGSLLMLLGLALSMGYRVAEKR